MSASAEGWAVPDVPGEPLAGQPEESDAWAGVVERVGEYLRAMGVVDAFHLELLSARARRGFQARMASAEVEEPMEVAIEEVNRLLNDWLDSELDLAGGDRQALSAARAAVLSGTVPGWAARFSGVAGQSIAAAIRAATVEPVPEPAPLAMEPSPILLCCHRLRHRVGARLRRLVGGASGQAADRGAAHLAPRDGPAVPAHLYRRTLYFSLVLLTTLGAMILLSASFQEGGIGLLELLMLVLYAILILWISASFWTATLGFLLLLTGRDRSAIAGAGRPLGSEGSEPFKVALVMPVYNEDPTRVFAGLRAMYQALVETGQHEGFEIFILSDTRDPDVWVQEELLWRQWSVELGRPGRVFYRNRVHNTSRKSGNLADYCRNWGGRYRYMIVLDADSMMSAETLVELVARMERNPDVGLIQVPPVPVNHSSLFARMLQFAGSLYGPIFAAGLSFWQLGTSNFWGHNAIIRVKPFADHCGLPRLPGKEPFGGDILSHDFVEAALLRRAGWRVWLAYDLGGSYEEVPPTLIDYAKRDRRWCQGNLQHTRLLLARGFKPLSRVHFAMGVMSYVASPLWLLFLIVAGLAAYLQSMESPVYFIGHNLFPVWPESYAVEMTTVLLVTLAMLFLPKILALVLLAARPPLARRFGGLLRAGLSVLVESLLSVLLAPVLMLFQSKFVLAILLRQNVGWPTQRRGDHGTGFAEAIAAHAYQTLIGVASGLVAYLYIPSFFPWFTPVLAGLILAVPVSMITSRTSLGRLARRAGLFLSAEESARPRVLQLLDQQLSGAAPAPCHGGEGRDFWLRAVVDPCACALHASLLPEETPNRRRHHYLEGLIFQLQDDGAASLSAIEKRALISHRDGLFELHELLWGGPRSPVGAVAA